MDLIEWLNPATLAELLPRLASTLEASPLGAWMRGSGWGYPVINLLHLLGLVLLVGPMLLLDLRLLGAARRFPVPDVSSALTPWAVVGLLLLLPSGFLLFAADAGPLLANGLLQVKVLLIALGIGNALLFRWLWSERLEDWDWDPSRFGQLQAFLSALCWLTAGTLGRLIAYG
jgi:hypothetical protein